MSHNGYDSFFEDDSSGEQLQSGQGGQGGEQAEQSGKEESKQKESTKETTTKETTTKQKSIEQQLAPCVGDGRITSGTALLTFTAEQACLSTDLPGTVPGAQTITWNTGETSRFVYTKTYVQNAGLVVAIKTGTISEGLFAGATAVMSIPATSNVLACLSAEGNTVNTALIEFVLTAP